MAKTRHCSSAPFLLLSKFQAATLSRLTPTHQQPTNDMSDEMKRSGLRSPNSSYHIQMSPGELRHFGTAWLLQLPMDSSGSSCRAFCIPRKKIGDGGRWEGMMHHHVLGHPSSRGCLDERNGPLFHRRSPRETPTPLACK